MPDSLNKRHHMEMAYSANHAVMIRMCILLNERNQRYAAYSDDGNDVYSCNKQASLRLIQWTRPIEVCCQIS